MNKIGVTKVERDLNGTRPIPTVSSVFLIFYVQSQTSYIHETNNHSIYSADIVLEI